MDKLTIKDIKVICPICSKNPAITPRLEEMLNKFQLGKFKGFVPDCLPLKAQLELISYFYIRCPHQVM